MIQKIPAFFAASPDLEDPPSSRSSSSSGHETQHRPADEPAEERRPAEDEEADGKSKFMYSIMI